MKRYCDTILEKFRPCDIGFSSYSETAIKSCYDEGKCNNMIDEDNIRCPMCKQLIKKDK